MIEMTPQQEMRYAMGNISESQWGATWHSRLEYILWDLVTGKRGTVGHMTPREAKHVAAYLKELAEDAGGWWAWQDGFIFIEMDDWKKLVAEKE